MMEAAGSKRRGFGLAPALVAEPVAIQTLALYQRSSGLMTAAR